MGAFWMNSLHLGQLDKSSGSDFSSLFNIKLKSRQSSTALGLLAALGLSACGGGGGQEHLPTHRMGQPTTLLAERQLRCRRWDDG